MFTIEFTEKDVLLFPIPLRIALAGKYGRVQWKDFEAYKKCHTSLVLAKIRSKKT